MTTAAAAAIFLLLMRLPHPSTESIEVHRYPEVQ
jgi:hypothetical protein